MVKKYFRDKYFTIMGNMWNEVQTDCKELVLILIHGLVQADLST